MGTRLGPGDQTEEFQLARGFWQSLAWASEILTTTGYGHDNQWRHPLMIAFVVAVQFIGVFLVFLVFPEGRSASAGSTASASSPSAEIPV